MAIEEESKPEVYYIPPNYEDAGGMLGGHFTHRNGIEMAVVCVPILLANVSWVFPNVSIQTSIITLILTVIPPAALCAFGIRGESISQILMAFVRFRKNRRKLSYIHFYDGTHVDIEKESQRKDVGTINLSQPAENIAARDRKAPAAGNAEDDDTLLSGKKNETERYRKPMEPIKTHLLNSAMKEILLKKLELGEDDLDE